MRVNATSLVGRYLEAVARVEALVDVDAGCMSVDRAIAQEAEAEAALLQQIKLTTRQDPSRIVKHPVAVALDGTLVVVAPDRADEWNEIILVIERRHIVSGE
jgi:hypothetical protein